MATISSAGIGSGLDVESLVSKLIAAERTPITQLAKRTDSLKTELSTYGKVQSALSTLRDAASKLTSPTTWGGTLATSSDTTAVTVSAGTGAAIGSVSVDVKKLAQAQTLVGTTSYASATTTARAAALRRCGFAIGVASHGIGTARAFQVSEQAGAFALVLDARIFLAEGAQADGTVADADLYGARDG